MSIALAVQLTVKVFKFPCCTGKKMNNSGLLTAKRNPVPLKSIEVELQVRDHVATVVSTLNYENKEDKPVEAVFVFPLPGDAAVCHFSAKVGQTHIVAEVKEKQQAREEYDDALSSGQQAFLLEESDQSPDIFSLSVGSLPPGESASIRLEYVTELAVQADDGLRFCLPAVLNPRYQPQGSEDVSVQVTSVPASLVPYSLSFSARVSSPRPVSKVESSCSLEPLQHLNTDQTQAMVKLAAGHKFDRDVELLIYYKDAHQPTAVVEAGQASAKPGTLMGDPVVMLSLYPEFPKSVMSSLTSCGEFVFLMDRSGSMDYRMRNGQSRIDSAKDTLLLLLKSLPMGCYFNIYSFGYRFEQIFPKSVEYNQQTMQEALKKVEMMFSDLGGTEILRPLEDIYSKPCIISHPRQLFVFTDGEVRNTKEVIDLVKKNAGSHRCFSFGIGEGVSSALINGMAKEGGGHAQFITRTDRMQPKVMQSLKFALHPFVADISVAWDLPKGVSATLLSPPVSALFQGQRSLIYAQLTGKSSKEAEGSVTVKYSLAGQPSQNQLHFNLKPAEDTGLTIHRLGARALIRSLEMEERKICNRDKTKVVQLSVQSGVSSSFTAFIAVNKTNSQAIQGPLVRRNVPTASLNYHYAPLKSKGSANLVSPRSQDIFASLRSNGRPKPGIQYMNAVLMQDDRARRVSPRSQDMFASLRSNCRPKPGKQYDYAALMPDDRARRGIQYDYAALIPDDRARSAGWVGCSVLRSSESENTYEQLRSGRCATSSDEKCYSTLRSSELKRSSLCDQSSHTLVSGSAPSQKGKSATGQFSQMKKKLFDWLKTPKTSLDTENAAKFQPTEWDVHTKLAGAVPTQSYRDPLLQLVSLQEASGCWLLNAALAAIVEKNIEDMTRSKPAKVSEEVWATVLALVWLYGFKISAKEEWDLLALKAALWLHPQDAPFAECVEAGNSLLGCSVQKDDLGL
ncbi:von Willebrand factor A domain-containing protein 5A-like isoform X5 [Melanotaenia boesemani]|uniref:von Willebrand factor A domain-containing protein 5A-like isoform X5 n=1 Tax=Melanotaenia boesemani TaxID=1250792 RepID=UPI001C03D95A|nr:von Willebrand factor A domain-containing protein 5A-like isoform X5 [Melanotaenia boesemani]